MLIPNVWTAAAILLGAAVVWIISRMVYNIWFHPLSKFPGPKLYAATWLPRSLDLVQGRIVPKIRQFHDKYGPIVRIGPEELSFITSHAVKDTYNHRQGLPQNPKDKLHLPPPNGFTHVNLSECDDSNHARQRSHLSHAFSSKALQEQQPLVSEYVDILMEKLNIKAASKEPQDMVAWFNFTTFDIIGDLTFGEPFYCLRDERYHPWIKCIFEGIKGGMIAGEFNRYGLFGILKAIAPGDLMRKRMEMVEYTKAHADKRMAQGETNRPDFITFMQRETKKSDVGMSRQELQANSEFLIMAGSETTASLLSGATFLMLVHPKIKERLISEIRGAFNKDTLDEMNFRSVTQNLPYMVAFLNEALRVYPPVPGAIGRMSIGKGTTIDGHFIPPGTTLTLTKYAAMYSPLNWKRPEECIPERWMGDPEFDTDDREAWHPFSMGPRGCIGRNLADVEMRLIFARLIWNFDLELCPGQQDWLDQETYLVWLKKPLNVQLTKVSR